MEDHVADRVRRLFLYLRELSELRSKTVRDLANYEQVMWFDELPRDRSASVFTPSPDGAMPEAWLEIDRVELPPFPEPPEPLAGWLHRPDLEDTGRDVPPLLDREEESVERSGDIDELYRQYVESVWKPWAEEHRMLQPAHDFYTNLFAVSEREQALGEVYELVVAMGLLAWVHGEHHIRRHLISSPVDVFVDRHTGRISVRPAESPEARNRLELEMLDASARGNPEGIRKLSDDIAEMDPLMLAGESEVLLRHWINQAQPSGSVDRSLTPPGQARETPQVTLAPALILRKRGQRTVGVALEEIARQVAETGTVPPGVAALATTDDVGADMGALEGAGVDDPEVYFPLESNDEQRQIVDRLTDHHGILVQGPPGTGKSHTIANLISHLLAQGKRVLVTSHTERALRVLHDKLPDEIKPLCISLLGRDRESVRALEDSVEEISSRQAEWSDRDADREVEELRRRLRDIRHDRAAAERDLRLAREAETHEGSIGTYRGTSQQIAKALRAERDELGWIRDVAETPTPAISDAEFTRLLSLTWELPPEAAGLGGVQFPDPDSLLDAVDLERLAERERGILDDYSSAQSRFGTDLGRWATAPSEHVDLAQQGLVDLARVLDHVARYAAWSEAAARDVLIGRSALWYALRSEVAAHQTLAAGLVPHVANVRASLVAEYGRVEILAGAEDLLSHVQSGGSLRTGVFAAGTVKRLRWLLTDVTVDGRHVESEAQLAVLVDRLRLDAALEQLRTTWGSRVEEPLSLPLRQRVAFYEAQLDMLDRVLGLPDVRDEAAAALDRVSHGDGAVDWTDADALRIRAAALRAARDVRNVEVVRAEIAEAKHRLGDDPHPILSALRHAVDARDGEAYRIHLSELRQAVGLAAAARERTDLADSLRAVAPMIGAELPAERSELWERRTAGFERAWHWKFAFDELARLSDPGLAHRLSAQIVELNRQERTALAQLSAKLAWGRMFAGLQPEHAQALSAWTVAVRKIGRGTGRYAPEHRRTARTYMGQARGAIPAWVMPMYRVAESLTVHPEAFDVVIVDEASQSSVESLFLFYLGKQIIVVGDDQQIAPDAVGVNMETVHRLQREFLDGVPFAELFEPTNSLFDQAVIRFGQRTVLREHFRCMPEIIELSNQIAYKQKALQPLRQFGAERLDPIKTVHLPHGYREGSRDAINRPEADEIVARIEKLCADPRYDGASFGVISLQGEAQARLIERMLVERLGPQAMVERDLTCGDAYAFQGDERDVIFLSMVAAPNMRIGPLADEQARRRFNVAASRARDQVWLVHSVLPEDLSATDMRREMLEYYLHPGIEHLEELADFDPTVRNAPFDSVFEQDVYLEIRRRGYRVAPQVPVAQFRIDLVVEGAEGRLAVECDGDAWHGAEQWDRDMARQRQLERCGWAFVRIRGSDFYRDPASALEPLWRELERRGIRPGQVDASMVTAAEPVTHPADAGALDVFAEPGRFEWPEAWGEKPRLGLVVVHPEKGEGRVAAVRRDAGPDEVFVRVKLGSGEEHDYTPEEYGREGFVVAGAEGSSAARGR